MTKKLFFDLLVVHASLVFMLSTMLTFTKWFPYGSVITGLREWLYTVF